MRANGVADWLHEIYRRNLFSGAVLVAKVGNVCFEGQYGYADLADINAADKSFLLFDRLAVEAIYRHGHADAGPWRPIEAR